MLQDGLGRGGVLAGSSAAGTPRPKPTGMYSRRPREELLARPSPTPGSLRDAKLQREPVSARQQVRHLDRASSSMGRGSPTSKPCAKSTPISRSFSSTAGALDGLRDDLLAHDVPDVLDRAHHRVVDLSCEMLPTNMPSILR